MKIICLFDISLCLLGHQLLDKGKNGEKFGSDPLVRPGPQKISKNPRFGKHLAFRFSPSTWITGAAAWVKTTKSSAWLGAGWGNKLCSEKGEPMVFHSENWVTGMTGKAV